VASVEDYKEFLQLLQTKNGETSEADRKRFAAKAFNVSSHYDSAIFNYFNNNHEITTLKISETQGQVLRYGENPHQKGVFHGDTAAIFDQLHGKELSYNNLLDLDAGLNLINEFDKPAFAILKHNNACGIAVRDDIATAYEAALAGDPVSAFGGVLVANRAINVQTAKLMNSLFFEIVVAPDFEADALELLYSKKNRIVLRLKTNAFPKKTYRSILNGFLEQERDQMTEQPLDLKTVTQTAPTPEAIEDLVFANKIVKHTRSNAIVLVKNKQLIGSGIGQTSRVDALKQAIIKAKEFGFDLHGAVLASDAFFPFADSIALAHEAGIVAVVQPGGSVRDQESIDYSNANGLAMVFTGIRHFKH
jgi:phosphoribosylaminoimidazolecarboxamide formyltransferase/IMP cyclohydrolase